MHTAGCTLREFRGRLQQALSLNQVPVQNLIESADLVRGILDTVLAKPLVFANPELPQDAIWWFRGTGSLPITDFRWTGEKSCELVFKEAVEPLDIEYLILWLDAERPDLDFVYLHAQPQNLFIAPKESRFNNTVHPAGTVMQEICDGLQSGRLPMQKAYGQLILLPQSGYFRQLLGMR